MAMGFNVAMFDIELSVVNKEVISEGIVAKILHIIDNRLINRRNAGTVQNWPQYCKCTSGTGTGKANCNVGCKGEVIRRIEEEE